MFDLEYKKNIQFLRGLSVIFVFLYHTNISYFERGYLGVDIFFVISGFVITQRLFQNYEREQKISLINFYSKRIKRIIPNLFFIVGCTYILYLLFGPPDLSLWNETLSALLGVSNIYYIVHDIGYFDNVFDDPLAHTWSLGVEEQFYLIYPLLIFLIFLSKDYKYIKLQIIFLFIFLISVILYKIKLDSDPVSAFFLSPLRFWELIFGAILFLNLKRFKKNNLISSFSLLLIILLVFSSFNYDYFYINFIIVILSGIFIVYFSKSKFIENSTFVYFGNISYSFYLWHLPVLFFFDLYILNKYNLDVISAFFITTLLSVITYHLIEQKFRYYTFKKLKNIGILFLSISSIIFATLIYIKYFNNSIRQDMRSFVNNINYLNFNYNWIDRIPFNNLVFLDDKKIYDHCVNNSKNFSLNSDGLKKECLRQKNYETLFFIEGNSHTAQFVPIFDKLKELENVYYKGSTQNNVSVDQVNELSEKFSEIFYVTNIDNKYELDSIKSNYSKFNDDIKLILFLSTPYPKNKHQPIKCLIQQINCTTDKFKDFEKRSLHELFDEVRQFNYINENIFLFDSYKALCPKKKCKVYDEDKDLLYYRDSSHLVVEGSETLTVKFYEFIKSLNTKQN